MWFLPYTFPASSDHTGKKRSVLPCVTRPTRLSYRGGTQVGLRRQVTGTRVSSDYPSWSLVPLFLWAGLTLILLQSGFTHTQRRATFSVLSLRSQAGNFQKGFSLVCWSVLAPGKGPGGDL